MQYIYRLRLTLPEVEMNLETMKWGGGGDIALTTAPFRVKKSFQLNVDTVVLIHIS